jgi:predicted membrane-bound mannosyltransferase
VRLFVFVFVFGCASLLVFPCPMDMCVPASQTCVFLLCKTACVVVAERTVFTAPSISGTKEPFEQIGMQIFTVSKFRRALTQSLG